MESCIGSRMLRSTGLVAGSSGGQHIRSNPGRQRCGSHLPFLPAGGRGGVLLQEGPLEPHLGGFLPSGLTLLQSHSDRKLQAADNRRPPTTSNRLSVSPRIRGHLTEVQCAEHSESRPCPLSDLASLQDPCSCSNPAKPANCVENVSPVKPQRPHTRRSLLAAGALLFSTATFLKHPSQSQAGSIVVSSVPSPKVLELLDQASEAWGRGLDPTSQNRWAALAEACTLFDKLVALEPERTEWREARGQLRVDSKKFNEALDDFNYVLDKNPSNFRGYSSRALAYEGLAYWDKAVEDYTTALRLGKKATGFDEPYVLNSRGNAFASLGQWSEALRDYELSVKGFQEGRQLDGAIYSAANAALMQIQLGNEKEGLKELTTVARRAPGSIDMRAALAALYWSQGREREAESTWQFACENINAGQLYDGCAKYRDQDWLRRIRRWPPVMADRMQDFFQLRHKT